VEFAVDGIYPCGMAHSPKPISEAVAQAKAAACKAASRWQGSVRKGLSPP
jgi:heterodisulfide reductase subunit A